MDTLLNLCKQLKPLAKLFRFAEVFIMLLFLSWISTHLPFALRISGEYCKKALALLFSPISIFCFGNTIVVCLLAKSGLFSGKSSTSIDNAVAEFCNELRSDEHDEMSVLQEVVFQDKEIICEESIKPVLSPAVPAAGGDVVAKDAAVEVEKTGSFYRRSKSEMSRSEGEVEREEEMGVVKEKLRRSETDVSKKRSGGGAEEEGVSGEEFRRTIEEFIAKQVRFHREESLAVVIHGQASLA